MIDADAIFRHIHLPYEWLLNRWNFTTNTSIAMPMDPEFNGDSWERIWYTTNKYNEVNPNAGFITAQNLPRTFEMIDAWISCPDDEERYPGCDATRYEWPAEQGAFGEYVRYEFNRDTDFKGFNCSDGNGFPEQGYECKGLFVRHYTTWKPALKNNAGGTFLEALAGGLQRNLLQNIEHARVHGNTTQKVEERYWYRNTTGHREYEKKVMEQNRKHKEQQEAKQEEKEQEEYNRDHQGPDLE